MERTKIRGTSACMIYLGSLKWNVKLRDSSVANSWQVQDFHRNAYIYLHMIALCPAVHLLSKHREDGYATEVSYCV
jgi:hypothetical protein